MAVDVSVANCAPEKIELLANDAPLVSLESRRSFTWDTSGFEEGNYQLVARAIVEGQVVTSEPRAVVVDRTVPTVLARSPQNGDTNVPFGSPFQIIFSEPVSSAHITDSTVRIVDSNGASVAKQLMLAADGKTLTIVLERMPSLPAQLTTTLQGVTDLAGNTLAPAGPWGFTVQLVSDASAPTVLARTPETGEDNVPLGAPFRVTFSEPIHPDSLMDSAVVITGSGSLALSKHLALSIDGRTLTIALAGTPALPVSLDIELEGLTDLAGNSLLPPVTSWAFTIPDWLHPWPLPVSGAVPNSNEAPVAVAVETSGAPVVAYVVRPDGTRKQQLVVRRWTGETWLDLAAPLNVIGDAYGPAIAVTADGAPIVAWLEYVGQTSEFYVMVARWSGSAWTSINGGRLDSSQSLNLNKSIASTYRTGSPSSMRVALAVDGFGNPTVAWPEVVSSGGDSVFNTLVAMWNGSTWSRLGSANTNSASNALRAALALHGGKPVLAVEEETVNAERSVNVFARRWDNGWAAAFGASPVNAGTAENGHMPAIGVESSGNPIVSFCEFDSTSLTTNVVVKRWNAISRTWDVVPVGGGDRILDARYPSLAVDDDGNRVLAYSASSGRQPTLLRWDAGANTWDQLGGALSSQAYASAGLALTSEGVPVIAWAQDGPNLPLTYDLMLKILNR